MHTPTTVWDRAPTDKELNSFYGEDKSTAVQDEIIETLTQTIRTVPASKLGLPYVKSESGYRTKLALYPIAEVLADYGTDSKPLEMLLMALEKSDCPLVASYRLALAERYADAWADDVEEVRGEE